MPPGETTTSITPTVARLLIAFIGALGLLLLWFGLTIVVRADRRDGRVDVTVERRFLGLLPLSRETVVDVVAADVYRLASSGTAAQRSGAVIALQLTARSGDQVRRTMIGPSIGMRPPQMAQRIGEFLANAEAAAFSGWWMPWLVNLAAIPFVLIAGATAVELLLRALGVMKS
jgi:hypothetical protein